MDDIGCFVRFVFGCVDLVLPLVNVSVEFLPEMRIDDIASKIKPVYVFQCHSAAVIIYC